MKVVIKNIFNTTLGRMWEKVTKFSSLQYVASPILAFSGDGDTSMVQDWEAGGSYRVQLKLFMRIPLGSHTIQVKTIDREKNLIVSEEKGQLAKVWNHCIHFKPLDEKRLAYVDEIEIKAGFLTFPVWCFAQFFYRHRQQRWKKLFQIDNA